MNKTKVGPNDPCPCGSGKKFKKCCRDRQEDSGAFPLTPADVMGQIQQALEGQEFSSLEEAQAFVDNVTRQGNQTAIDEFRGLSPEQMHHFLNFPFDSPRLVSFPEILDATPAAPILTLFELLASAIGEPGLKTTAKGNLPRNFCREAALSFMGEEAYQEHIRICGINKEEDFFELHVTRLTAELAGLIRKFKGKFILSSECRKILTGAGLSGIYPKLFRAYVQKFNWGYGDAYPDIHIIQHSFLFTLYLLTRHGDTWRSHQFYEDSFIRAFPMAIGEVTPGLAFTPEQEVKACYTLRSMIRFAGFLGLADLEAEKTDKTYAKNYQVKKTPLLADAVRFHLQG